MKLYDSTDACSLSPRIALHEAGLAHEGVLAPTKSQVLPDGSDFRAINAKGYVPLLELDNGERPSEGVAACSPSPTRPRPAAWRGRVGVRPAVQAALKAEGLA